MPPDADLLPLLLAADTGWALRTAYVVQWLALSGIVVICGSIALCLIRIVIGPTLADRGAALDVIGVQLVGIIILLTIRTGSFLFVDGILIVSLLAFAGTIAVAQFIARPYMRRAAEARRAAESASEAQSEGA